MLVYFLIEQARQTLGLRFLELLFHRTDFLEWAYLEIMMYLCLHNSKTKTDMEVISIERSTYEVIGLPLRSSKNCWRASIASSQRWRRWPVEAMTKGWAIGLTTKTFVKCWTSVQEHYRLYGIMGRWPILKSTARCTISMRMWLWEDTWNVWERKAGSSRVRRSAWWNDGDNKAWEIHGDTDKERWRRKWQGCRR